jgi:hypothetical protein
MIFTIIIYSRDHSSNSYVEFQLGLQNSINTHVITAEREKFFPAILAPPRRAAHPNLRVVLTPASNAHLLRIGHTDGALVEVGENR